MDCIGRAECLLIALEDLKSFIDEFLNTFQDIISANSEGDV